MTASERLRDYDCPWSEGASWTLWEAVPELIAVLEAAEGRWESGAQYCCDSCGIDELTLDDALAALEAKLAQT